MWGQPGTLSSWTDIEIYLLTHIFKTNMHHHKCAVGGSRWLWNNMAGHAGKWGLAVELSTNLMTQRSSKKWGKHFRSIVIVPHVTTANYESNIVDLFTIGANNMEEKKKTAKLFIHQVRFHGPQGNVVQVWANIDDGAMREVMSTSMFRKVKHRLGTPLPSSQLL